MQANSSRVPDYTRKIILIGTTATPAEFFTYDNLHIFQPGLANLFRASEQLEDADIVVIFPANNLFCLPTNEDDALYLMKHLGRMSLLRQPMQAITRKTALEAVARIAAQFPHEFAEAIAINMYSLIGNRACCYEHEGVHDMPVKPAILTILGYPGQADTMDELTLQVWEKIAGKAWARKEIERVPGEMIPEIGATDSIAYLAAHHATKEEFWRFPVLPGNMYTRDRSMRISHDDKMRAIHDYEFKEPTIDETDDFPEIPSYKMSYYQKIFPSCMIARGMGAFKQKYKLPHERNRLLERFILCLPILHLKMYYPIIIGCLFVSDRFSLYVLPPSIDYTQFTADIIRYVRDYGIKDCDPGQNTGGNEVVASESARRDVDEKIWRQNPILGNLRPEFGVVDMSKVAHRPVDDTLLRSLSMIRNLRKDSIDVDIYEAARREVEKQIGGENPMIGNSYAILKIYYDIYRAFIENKENIMIYGPVGAGKEVLLDILKRGSTDGELFLVLNLAGYEGDAARSAIFGHAEGAYTGANSARKGFIESAGSGTLVLDNAQVLKKGVQALLLRTLESNGEYHVFGCDKMKNAKCRFIAVFNVDPDIMVEKGKLLIDWPERFPIHIRLPCLDERKDDIPLLVNHFVRQWAAKRKIDESGLSQLRPDVERVKKWQDQSFSKANVRMLKNEVDKYMDKQFFRQSLKNPSRQTNKTKRGRPSGRSIDDDRLLGLLSTAIDTGCNEERFWKSLRSDKGDSMYQTSQSLKKRISRIASAQDKENALGLYDQLASKFKW